MEILYGQKRFNDVWLNTPLYTIWKSLQKIQSFGYMSVVWFLFILRTKNLKYHIFREKWLYFYGHIKWLVTPVSILLFPYAVLLLPLVTSVSCFHFFLHKLGVGERNGADEKTTIDDIGWRTCSQKSDVSHTDSSMYFYVL